MNRHIIKTAGLFLSFLLLISGVLIFIGCEDTISKVIEEEVRLAENHIVFLTVFSSGTGSTTPEGTVEVVQSTSSPISASAGTDYMFYKWSTNDSGVTFDDVYSENTNVTLNNGDATVTAEFVTGNSIHLLEVVSGNTSLGTTDPNGSFSVVNNRPYTITAIPNSRYHLDNWSIEFGASNLSLSDTTSNPTVAKIVNPTSTAAKIQANFALNTYNLVVQQDAEGNGGESGDSNAFDDGASIPINAGNPITGAVFTNWSVVSGDGVISFDDANSTNTNVTITGGTNNETVVVRANFSRMLFIAGYENNSTANTACYWKYETETGALTKIVLGNGTDASEAKDIKLYQNELYIAGTEHGKMCYWTDDVYSSSPYKEYENTNHTNAVANGVFLYPDAEVYMVGGADNTPICFKDGDETSPSLDLSFGTEDGAANDLYIYDDGNEDVLVAGLVYGGSTTQAVYWKNPVRGGGITTSVSLSNTSNNGVATSIFQYGSAVYIGGWEGSSGCYWMDYDGPGGSQPVQNIIPGYNTDTKVYALCLNPDEDLYLVGEDYGQPTCWNPNNSEEAYLDIEVGGSGAAYDIFYCNDGSDNFYVVGYSHNSKDYASLWVNPDGPSTGRIDLTNGSNNARANAVISY